MAKKTWNEPIDKNVDWGGDENTGGLPVSGAMVQKFIKESLDSKAGLFHYDTANNRYVVFSDETSRDIYLEDPTRTDLIIGTFDAPFNYSAEIHLETPSYNAVFFGATGNYIDFTFDVKNKQGASTGESVVITFTFVRNAIKQTFTQVAKHGDRIHFNVDKYLGEGTNTIIIGVTGQTTLAATTVAVTYQVVNLQLSDETDISTIYDLSNGSKVIEIPFKLSGFGIKVVEWYLDNTLLDFVKNEDEVVEVETQRVKYIELANLQQGRHSLQIRAYTTINGERFYTPTLYRDILVYTGVDTKTIMGFAMEIPAQYGLATSGPILYGVTQYIPHTLRFATYSPLNKQSVQVNVVIDEESLGVVSSQNGVVNEFSIVSKTYGSKTLHLVEEDSTYDIPMLVNKTTMTIEEITSELKLDFTAIGRSNNSEGRQNWEYGDFVGTFSGFNWNATSGWVNNRLKMNAGSSFAIDYAPLSGNPTAMGRTLEFEFKTTNVNDDNAVICDLRNSAGTGLLITATKATLTSSNGVVVETSFKAEENVRICFVINRASSTARKGLTLIYANGSVSRCVNWASTDNYESNKQIKFEATAGAEVELKSIRVYNAALTDDNILNNYILYRDTVSEMLEVYDRNDIFVEGTTTLSPDKMASRLPVMIVTGNIPTLENTSDKKTQIIVDIEYTNMQDPSRSFKMVGAAMTPQGTSSMGYPKKNFKIYTQEIEDTILYDANGKIVQDKLYSFKEGARPVHTWCLKADYAESSGTHNVGIARMWNKALYNMQIDGQYVCRTDAQKAAIDAEYPYDVRTTIDGFPILLFYRKNPTDELIFIGKYNFNNDKSTEGVFGFVDIPGFNNERMQCWELLNNGHPLSLFQTMDGFDTQWKEAYESRYPDTKTPYLGDLKAFSQWLVGINGDHERFATEKWEHFKVYPMAAYYCYLMRHAAADQLVKNSMLTSEDGVHFYFIQYDNDTINGLINTGDIDILPTDDRQSKDASGEYKFAGHGSVLWNMFEADSEFMELVKEVDNALYSAGISYNECIKVFDEEQADKWVERVYNQDSEYKYVGPFVNQGINNLFMMQGKRDLHRRWWLAKRFSIYDAKFVSGEYKSQSIELKCMNDTPSGQRFTITSGYPLDYGYGINNIARQSGVTLGIGESHTFETIETVNLGDPIRIYGAPNLAEVDLSEMANRLAVVTIANVYSQSLGTRLKKFVLGGATVNNVEVAEISGLKQAKMLEYLDVTGMKGITSLDLSSQPYMQTLKAKGSGVAAIELAKGAPITTLELPSAMRILKLSQLPYITTSGITIDGGIGRVKIIDISGCPNLSNNFNWVYNWYSANAPTAKECSLTMDNVDWKDVDPTQLIALKNLGTLNLKGKVEVSEVDEGIINQLREVFGDTAFSSNSDFYIIAPPTVFLSGRTELLEGESEQYISIVFGGEILRTTFSIVSGANSYVSIDPQTGLLTTTEGMGNRGLTLRVTVVTSEKTVTKDMAVNVKARTYPSSSQTSMSGPSRLDSTRTTYRISYSTADINGNIAATWTLSGMDGYAQIESYDDTSCVIRKLAEETTLIQGTLSCTLKKKANNSTLFTITKTIEILNDSIAETDEGIVAAFYSKGLCANSTYITKDEAMLITDADLQSGSSSSTSIFYPQRNKIKSFDGLKHFKGLTSIKINTFNNCSSLTSIAIPEGVTSIGSQAFLYCKALTSITLPDSLTSIESSAFSGCSSLTSITLPDSLTSIRGSAFASCTSLTSIAIPEGVTSIGSQVFYRCSSLTSVTLPDSLTSIGSTAFGDCKALASITFPDSLISIGSYAFSGCSSLTSITLPDSLTSMGDGAFQGCTSLASITFPDSLTSIGSSVFHNCGSVMINVSEKNSHYLSIDGILFNKAQTSIILYAKDKIQATYTLPDDVTSIGNGAFSGCSSLTSITFPDSLTSIGSSAFADCISLTSIAIPEGVTSIGSQAFLYCKALTSITLPDSLTSIESSAFSGCTSLTSITLPDSLTSIESKAFYACSSLASITIPEGVTSMGDGAFQGCTSLASITLPDSLTSIRGSAFASCTSLTSITIPDGVARIESDTFNNCSSLTSVTLPDSLTSIGGSAFNSCFALASLTCLRTTAPSVQSNTFGSSTSNYAGRNTYNTGENMLYVPKGATGYDASYWLDPLQNATKCGFTLSATL